MVVMIDVPEVALVDVNYMCCVLSGSGWTCQLKLMGMSCVCDVVLGGSWQWHVELHVHWQIAEHGQWPPVRQQSMDNLSMKEMGH
jgi:hypothetical protein